MPPLVKNILAAVVGYLAMAVALFIMFSLMWQFLGPSAAFLPGSWEVSLGWSLGSIALGLVGAFIGGRVCVKLAHGHAGVWILIVLVIALGIVEMLTQPELVAGPRPDDISMMEATVNARQPTWITWLNPVIGVVGVWFGAGRLRA